MAAEHSPAAEVNVRGDGIVFGSPGIYHYPVAHGFVPSRESGFGAIVQTLCGRSGVVYAAERKNLWPNDRLCKFCEKAAA